MKTMLTQEILEKHKKWLLGDKEGERADLSGADCRAPHVREADLCEANLSGADLREADLCEAVLSGADLREADLRGANLSWANLSEANLSGCKGLLSPIDYLKKNFEKTKKGYICYKTFNSNYETPNYWEIKKNSIITEVVNADRTADCACGVNVGTLEWVQKNNNTNGYKIWKCLIEWEWLAGVAVPYNTDGKIRCEKIRLLEVI
jgi:hypothetical protein